MTQKPVAVLLPGSDRHGVTGFDVGFKLTALPAHLEPFLGDRHIRELSGGQQQRVFLARALVQEASVLLLDEPLNGVDAATEQVIIGLMRELRDAGVTILQATHDLETAADISDLLCFVNRGIVAFGPPEETFTAHTLHGTFGGEVLVLEGANERRMPQTQFTQAVAPRPRVHSHRPVAKDLRVLGIGVREQFAVDVQKGVGVLCEPAAGGLKQPLVRGVPVEHHLHHLERGRCCLPHELGIIVSRVGRGGLPQGISHPAQSHPGR
jgi:hypothetical protein